MEWLDMYRTRTAPCAAMECGERATGAGEYGGICARHAAIAADRVQNGQTPLPVALGSDMSRVLAGAAS